MASQEIANYLLLHHCMISRNKTLLMSILDSDVDINERDEVGMTPLHLAASENYLEGIELLLERGADVNVMSFSGDSPLHDGIDNYEIVKILLNKGALPDCRNVYGQTPLLIVAVINKNIPIINLLLSLDANIELEDCSGNSALRMAILIGSHEIIKILLDCGANIEAKCRQGSTPLHVSARVNDCLTTKLLLDMGANPNTQYGHENYLKLTCIFDSKEDLQFLGEFPRYGDTPLHIATNNKLSSIVKVLLDGGANPDIKNGDSYAPLHISAIRMMLNLSNNF